MMLYRACDCFSTYCEHNPKREFKKVFLWFYKPLFRVHFSDQLITDFQGQKFHRFMDGIYTKGSKISR